METMMVRLTESERRRSRDLEESGRRGRRIAGNHATTPRVIIDGLESADVGSVGVRSKQFRKSYRDCCSRGPDRARAAIGGSVLLSRARLAHGEIRLKVTEMETAMKPSP